MSPFVWSTTELAVATPLPDVMGVTTRPPLPNVVSSVPSGL